MSAKICSYSSKYKTLVLSKRKQLDDFEFNEWVNSHFSNPSLAVSQTRSGDVFLSDHDVINKKLNQSQQKIDSIKSYFVLWLILILFHSNFFKFLYNYSKNKYKDSWLIF